MEAVLAREIKAFRKQFRNEHGRDPSKKDMDRQPDVAATYKTWLAIKSSQPASSSGTSRAKHLSASSHSTSSEPVPLASRSHGLSESPPERNGQRMRIAGHKRQPSEAQATVDMAPPPTTPRKKPKADLMRTPTKRGKGTMDTEMASTMHDSGGSVRSLIDVPTTPNERPRSRSVNGSASPGTPSRSPRQVGQEHDFDDGTSPTKLRTLIASFAATRALLTPTKSGRHEEEEDERLATKLRTAAAQHGTAFTPRTKARKRLRGEVVVTPGKSMSNGKGAATMAVQAGTSSRGQARDAATTPTKVRPVKRQRGMGTLKDFGIVPIAGPQAKSMAGNGKVLGASVKQQNGKSAGMELGSLLGPSGQAGTDDEDGDDDDDMIGPSPSARRIVNMQIQSFRPLFGEAAVALGHPLGSDDDEEEVAAAEDELPQSSQTALDRQSNPTDTALTTPAADAALDSDEEDRLMVRAYERYDGPGFYRSRSQQSDEEEGEVGDRMLGGLIVPINDLHRDSHRPETDEVGFSDEEENNGSLLRTLSISSPQCKRARDQQRRTAAKNVRQLLQADGALLEEEEDTQQQEQHEQNQAAGQAANKEGVQNKAKAIAHGNAKTARMMRGTLTKAGKRALAAAEAAEETAEIADAAKKAGSLPSDGATKQSEKKLILRRGREDDWDEEDGFNDITGNMYGSDTDLTDDQRAHAPSREDDDWASDVDSVDYGLGDGYMDELDVI